MADSGRAISRHPLPAGSFLAAAAVVAALLLVAGRYGFHRDEYYFIESGRHVAWAQPDNPMLVPYLAAGWYSVVGGHLWAFRILPALSAAAFVLIAGLVAPIFQPRVRRPISRAISSWIA